MTKALQSERPDAPHYLEVTTTSTREQLDPPVRFTTTYRSIDGKVERFRHLILLSAERRIPSSEEIRVALRNTSAPEIAGPAAIEVYVQKGGEPTWAWLHSPARYQVKPGPATSAWLFAPSQQSVDEAIDIQLTLLDEFFNPATDSSATAELAITIDPDPASSTDSTKIEVDASRAEWTGATTTFRVTPPRTGFASYEARVRLRDVVSEGTELAAFGGPTRIVDAGSTTPRVYWGDSARATATSAKTPSGQTIGATRAT